METKLLEIEKTLKELREEVARLSDWQKKRQQSQLQLPLDQGSQNIIKRYQTY